MARRPIPPKRQIALVVSRQHVVHNVRVTGYYEAPVRISSILRAIKPTGLFREVAPRQYPDSRILAVHDTDFVSYLKEASHTLKPGEPLYAYVFPVRNTDRLPDDLEARSGYYCMDTFTPISRNAYLAARHAVDCALTAADELLNGANLSYALVRPPGHHAERRVFGGFCYLNSAAIAAHYLSESGKVAMLDVDYHHGNGQQEIFYRRSDVLTISIHGHPNIAYPYYSGFFDERGEGAGDGFNLNIPLPEEADGESYRRALRKALRKVEEFGPRYLVVCLGLDTAKGDPTGTWSLVSSDFEANGSLIAVLGLPTLIVQEGGYNNRMLGANTRGFFKGLWSAGNKA